MPRTLLLSFVAVGLYGQQPQPRSFTPPPDLTYRKVDIYSAGTRMGGEVFAPVSAEGKKLPAIIMAHGWGGNKVGLRPEAIALAKAGFLVVAFDYRGWGDSDSRLILTSPAPAERPNHRFTAEVQEVREVVDPLDQAQDWLNAISWTVGEPQCDVNHIGLWGSSFSGGLVVYAAERDVRVKAIHSQVGYMNGTSWVLGWDRKNDQVTAQEATRRARGELGYPAPLGQVVGQLRGGPIRDRFLDYNPAAEAARAGNCAMQFVIAEKEELFENKDNALLAYNLAKGPKNLVVVPGITHYGIYGPARAQAEKLAIDWFNKYLKP